jgi:2',3'-cyclic-nucleotide 2'-phosphodiesterase (5'-nucleotidase family)
MFETMTQIGRRYGIDAKSVGKILYDLKIRDPQHPQQKGFPYEQAITHGIAKAYTGRTGETYYRYDIERIREEFETAVRTVKEKTETSSPVNGPVTEIEKKLQGMLSTLNEALSSGSTEGLFRLKADIADLYALLPAR